MSSVRQRTICRVLSFSPGFLRKETTQVISEVEQETNQKPTTTYSDPAERRNSLFAYLGRAIRLSYEKMSSKGNGDIAKQAWGRLMVSAIATYGSLIKDVELEGIEDVVKKSSVPKIIKVSTCIEEDAERVMADPDLLKRILGNLVANAVQAMPEGGKLVVRSYQEPGDTIITVQDTGVGIPEAVKPKLFTPLFTTKSKGQGFGLAIVKRMTEALNGTITFESEEGKGTKFIIRLPPRKK